MNILTCIRNIILVLVVPGLWLSCTDQALDEGSSALLPTTSSMSTSDVSRGITLSSSKSESYTGVGQQTGVWVTGSSTMSVKPDLALINVGVETEASTVKDARDRASKSMDRIISTVKDQGLTETDIQTTSFNIWPRYDYNKSSRTLVGYTVSNMVSIKVRELDNLGSIVDEVANAGGNATRVDGIRFTVDDKRSFEKDLRAAAVADAKVKAQHFAELTGIKLGSIAFISEGSIGQPGAPTIARGFALEGLQAVPDTPISGGELTLGISVQLAYTVEK